MTVLPHQLPALEGRRGDIVRIFYWLLAAATLIVVAGSLVFNALDFFRNVPATLRFGFRTYTASHQVQIGEVAGPGTRATGLEKGRWLVAIEGERLPRGATEYWVGAKLAAIQGDAVTLSVRDEARRVTSHRMPRLDRVWTARDPSSGLPVWGYASISFLILEIMPLFLLAAALLLAQRRPRDPEAMLFAVGFLLLCFNSDVAFWLNSMARIGPGMLNVIVLFGWAALLVAVAGFPDGRFTSLPAKLVPAGLALVGMVVLAAPFTGAAQGWLDWSTRVGALILFTLAAFAVMRRYRRTAEASERQQIKWVAMGFVIAALAALSIVPAEILGLQLRKGDPLVYLIYQFGRLLIFLPLPIGLLVSLLRYRLYDADAAISRSAAYAMLTVTLLGIFTASEKVIEVLGESYFGGSMGAVAGGIAAAVAAVAIAPLHHRMTHWAEHRFQKGLVKLRKGLPALVGDLRETATPAAIADAVLARVEAGVRARRSALIGGGALLAVRGVSEADVTDWRRGWTPGDGDAPDCDRGNPMFPMRVPLAADGCGNVGWLLLGPRPDGSFYGKDEREALAEIADPVARALAVARDRATNAQAVVEVTQGLRARIASLEAAVARLLGAGTAAPAE